MKAIKQIYRLLFLLLVFESCTTEQQNNNEVQQQKILTAVSGANISSSILLKHQYNNQNYYFDSKESWSDFKKNLKKFLANNLQVKNNTQHTELKIVRYFTLGYFAFLMVSILLVGHLFKK